MLRTLWIACQIIIFILSGLLNVQHAVSDDSNSCHVNLSSHGFIDESKTSQNAFETRHLENETSEDTNHDSSDCEDCQKNEQAPIHCSQCHSDFGTLALNVISNQIIAPNITAYQPLKHLLFIKDSQFLLLRPQNLLSNDTIHVLKNLTKNLKAFIRITLDWRLYVFSFF